MSDEGFNEALEEFARIADEIDKEMEEEESEPVYICACCGDESSDMDDMITIEGEMYCMDCATYCDECGDPCLRDDLTFVSSSDGDGMYMCDTCIDDHTVRCHHCNEITHERDLVCDDYTSLCQSCYYDYYTRCDECESIIHQDHAYYSERDDRTYCESCYDKNESDKIHPYSYKPSVTFHSASNEYHEYKGYGLEIETDHSGNADRCEYSNDLYNISNDERLFYLKEDGSLSSDGIEIVTHPGTLAYWMQTQTFDQIRKIALSYGYRSHDISSCGLHIHASKTLFGDTDQEQELAITKMIILLDRFWDQMVKISRRSEESINNWASKYDLEKPSYNEVYGKANHYRVVCLTSKTVELRMFKGTLKVSSIKGAIEFYDGLIRFSKVMSLNTVLSCSFDQLREYLEKDASYLPEYLNTRIGVYQKPINTLCFDHVLDADDITYEHEVITDQVVNNHVIIEA